MLIANPDISRVLVWVFFESGFSFESECGSVGFRSISSNFEANM